MTFRRFKQADISGICELINYELGYCVTENDLAIRINQMQKDKNYCIFVAENDNKVIAFIGLHIGLAFEFSGKVMRIIALAVKKITKGKALTKNYYKQQRIMVLKIKLQLLP